MNGIEEAVLAILLQLPSEEKREAPNVAGHLKSDPSNRPQRKSVKVLCADLRVRISAEKIGDARTKIWANLPRNDFSK